MRLQVSLTLLFCCLTTLSCAAGRIVAVEEIVRTASRPVDVVGYITSDGRYHAVDGRMVDTGDSLRFEVPHGRGLDIDYEVVSVLPRQKVASLRIPTAAGTARNVGVAVISLIAALGIVAVIAITQASGSL